MADAARIDFVVIIVVVVAVVVDASARPEASGDGGDPML